MCPRCGCELDYCECYDVLDPVPTTEDICGREGHRYVGDDGSGPDAGRCYCGKRTYPTGGPEEAVE